MRAQLSFQTLLHFTSLELSILRRRLQFLVHKYEDNQVTAVEVSDGTLYIELERGIENQDLVPAVLQVVHEVLGRNK